MFMNFFSLGCICYEFRHNNSHHALCAVYMEAMDVQMSELCPELLLVQKESFEF